MFCIAYLYTLIALLLLYPSTRHVTLASRYLVLEALLHDHYPPENPLALCCGQVPNWLVPS